MLKTDDRYKEMVSMRFDDFMTLKDIGKEYGISKERVRQIIGNTGAIRSVQRNEKISNSTKSNTELADLHGLEIGTISQLRNGAIRHEVDGGVIEIGHRVENYVSETMKNISIPNTLMPNSHPFDMMAFDSIKIDIKGCLSPQYIDGSVNPRWGFNMDTKRRGYYCEFFICVVWRTRDCFIIPYDIVGSDARNIYFCWPTERPGIGKYQKYHNRWDLLWQKALGVTLNDLMREE